MAVEWLAICGACVKLLSEEIKSVGLIGRRTCACCGAVEPWKETQVGSGYSAATAEQIARTKAVRAEAVLSHHPPPTSNGTYRVETDANGTSVAVCRDSRGVVSGMASLDDARREGWIP